MALEARNLRPDCASQENPSSTKNTQISWAWWHVPVRSQLLGRLRWEEYPNPGGRGYSEPRFHHWTPAWATEPDRLHFKKKKPLKGNIESFIIYLTRSIKSLQQNRKWYPRVRYSVSSVKYLVTSESLLYYVLDSQNKLYIIYFKGSAHLRQTKLLVCYLNV